MVEADLQNDMAADAQRSIPPPQGVTQPRKTPQVAPSSFGFVEKAERWNSRAAMIGFFALLAVEFFSKKGLLELMGIRVGEGLGFEF